MSEPTRDPVHRARYTFEPDGANLFVDAWIEPGGGLPAHHHPRQEERWSVIEGRVRFQLGRTKRVIGPQDGELIVLAGQHARDCERDRRGGPPALPRHPGPRSAGLSRGERGGGPPGPLHARRHSAEPAWRALGGRLPQAAPRGRRDVVPAAPRAVRDDRPAGALGRSAGAQPRRPADPGRRSVTTWAAIATARQATPITLRAVHPDPRPVASKATRPTLMKVSATRARRSEFMQSISDRSTDP